MRRWIYLFSIAAAIAISANARAEQSQAGDENKNSGHVDLAIDAGFGSGQARHPHYIEEEIYSFERELSLSFSVNRYLSLGAQFSHFAMRVKQIENDLYVRRGSKTKSSTPQAAAPRVRGECLTCTDYASGGDEIAADIAIMVGGLYAEFAPLGKEGFYAGLTGGVGSILLESSEVGGALAARTGYRYFVSPKFAMGFNLGLAGLIAEQAHAWLAFFAAELHFRFF